MTSSRKHNLKVKQKSNLGAIAILLKMNNTECNERIIRLFPSSQSLMLSIAKGRLEKEAKQCVEDKAAYMAQNCPELSLPHSVQELQVFTRHIHSANPKRIHTNDVHHTMMPKDLFLIRVRQWLLFGRFADYLS